MILSKLYYLYAECNITLEYGQLFQGWDMMALNWEKSVCVCLYIFNVETVNKENTEISKT